MGNHTIHHNPFAIMIVNDVFFIKCLFLFLQNMEMNFVIIFVCIPVIGEGQSPCSDKMAKVGERNANVPPCIIGNLRTKHTKTQV